MNYMFATENMNYEDYASGRVLYNQQGATSFPVRLASEIFQRCAFTLSKKELSNAYTLYDPCCGGAYLLTTLGYLHGEKISAIYASDIDENVISLAERNLSLLTIPGLDERTEQIQSMINEYGKTSHQEALQSALRFREMLEKRTHLIDTHCFLADATKAINLPGGTPKIDIVITDLPYGEIVHWDGEQDENQAVTQMLDNLLPILATNAILAIISRKKTKIKHENYKRTDLYNVGKRLVTILQPV